MTRKPGILVVDTMYMWKAGVENGSLPKEASPGEKTSEEIFARYMGFDGLTWPGPDEELEGLKLEWGVAPVGALALVRRYVSGLPQGKYKILLLADPGPNGSPGEFPGWSFRGFDLGEYEGGEEEFSGACYSVIACEILYGLEPTLCALKACLNEWYLFRTVEDALHATSVRDALVRAKSRKIERGVSCSAIGIFVPEEEQGAKPSC